MTKLQGRRPVLGFLVITAIALICMSLVRPVYTRQLLNTVRRSTSSISATAFVAPRHVARVSGFTLPFALFGSSAKQTNQEGKMGGDYEVKKSDSEWHAVLSKEQVRAAHPVTRSRLIFPVPGLAGERNRKTGFAPV